MKKFILFLLIAVSLTYGYSSKAAENGNKTDNTANKIAISEILTKLNLGEEEFEMMFDHAFESKYISETKKSSIFDSDDMSDFEKEFESETSNLAKALADGKLTGYFEKDAFHLNLGKNTYILTSFYEDTIIQNLKNLDEIMGFSLVYYEESFKNTPTYTFKHDESDSITLFYILDNDVNILFHNVDFNGEKEDWLETDMIKEFKLNKNEVLTVKAPLPEGIMSLQATVQKNNVKSKYFFASDGYGAPAGIQLYWK